jgi:23S rRNA pseudouridine2605 synthase
MHTGKAIFSGEGNGQAPNYSAANLKGLEVEGDESNKDTIRLNRFIANAGICSRRDADRLIQEGKITVNNELVTEMGYQVELTDVVHYNGKQLQRERNVYLLLNKPKDHITTVDDPDERKTVMDIVSHACEERVYPVGRLDRNTTGLLLLTNDGELAEKLAHPSNEIQKIYQVNLDKPLTDDDFQKIVAGVTLDDGLVPVDDIDIVSPDRTIVGLEIHLGRNRIVRRLFESLGYTVVKLDRVMYAGLTKKDLPRGHYRFLTEAEVINLKFRI